MSLLIPMKVIRVQASAYDVFESDLAVLKINRQEHFILKIKDLTVDFSQKDIDSGSAGKRDKKIFWN